MFSSVAAITATCRPILLTSALPAPSGRSGSQGDGEKQSGGRTAVTPALERLQSAAEGNDSLCSYCCCSICELFFLELRESMHSGEGKRCSWEEAGWLDKDFRTAQRSEAPFDLPLSCIGFSSRTPPNQHHLLRSCIRTFSANLPVLSRSPSMLWQGRLRSHGNSGQG